MIDSCAKNDVDILDLDSWEWAAQEVLGADAGYDVDAMRRLLERAPAGAETRPEYSLMAGYLEGLTVPQTDIDKSLGAWLTAAREARATRQVHRLSALIQGAPRQIRVSPEYHELQGFAVALHRTANNHLPPPHASVSI